MVNEKADGDEDDATKRKKRDESAFTIADGTVQRLLVEELFGSVSFRDVVGEEDGGGEGDDGVPSSLSKEEIDASWYRVEGLTVPLPLRPLLDDARREIRKLALDFLSLPSSSGVDDGSRSGHYEELTVFIDPIDGTREFSTGKGEQCSVCVGFADGNGRAVAGVVYRPLTTTPTWASGAASEGYADAHLLKIGDDADGGTSSSGLLTTNGSISPFLSALMDELECPRIPSGGAGNKMLMLLELNHGAMYVQDRGVSRWDTCGAEACLVAHGGSLTKLTSFFSEDGEPASSSSSYYTYLANERNSDFVPGLANLTPYNSNFQKGDAPRKAMDSEEVKPYANLCGLVALGRGADLDGLRDAVERASRTSPPSYD